MGYCRRLIIVLLIALISSTSPNFATDSRTLKTDSLSRVGTNITNYSNNNSSSEPSLEQHLTDELSLSDILTFFRNDWNNTLGLTNKHKKYFNTYLTMMETVLGKISIPRDVNAVRELSKILVAGDEDIFGQNSPFISVQEYINDLTATPSKLLKMVNNMHLNKMRLFDRLLVSSASSDEAIKFYGTVALQNILHTNPSILDVDQLKLSEINYVYKNNTDLKFIHPEYESYFVAKYIIHASESGIWSPLIQPMLKFLENPEYAPILQYMNGNIKNNSVYFKIVIRNIVERPAVFSRVLDNLVAHGFDSLAAAIFEQLNDSKIANKYFKSVINSNTKYYFGMLSTSEAPTKCSRQEMMIRMNMEETFKVVLESKTHLNWNSPVLRRISDLKTYLNIIVSQSKPSELIFRLIMDCLPLPYEVGYLNKLLYNVIINAGIEGRLVARELIIRGANAQAVNIDDRTLVHIAVKSGDLDLLRFVVEELRVPIRDTSTKSILIDVLDLNPFPDFSRPKYWQMVHYLITNGDLKVPNRSHPQLSHPAANITTDEFKELSKSFARIMANPIFSEINPITLSSDVQSLRRNLVLQNCHDQIRHQIVSILTKVVDTLTLTEVLLKYRGYSKLSASEELFFQHAIESALLFDTRTRPLTPNQLARVEAAISSNIGTMDDLYVTQKLLYKKVFPHLDDIETSSVARTVMSRIRSNDDSAFNDEHLTLPKMILQTKSDIYRTIVETSRHKLDEQSLIYSTLRRTRVGLPTDNYVNGLLCISRRRQRNPTGCKISHQDVAQVTEETISNGNTRSSINADEALRWLHETTADGHEMGSYLPEDISGEQSTRQNQMIDVLNDLVRFRKLSYYGDDAAEFNEILDAGSVEEAIRRRQANEMYADHIKAITKGNYEVMQQMKEQKKMQTASLVTFIFPMIRGAWIMARECITYTKTCGEATNAMFWSVFYLVGPFMVAPDIGRWVFSIDIRLDIQVLKRRHLSNYDEEYANLRTALAKRDVISGLVIHYLLQGYTMYSEIDNLVKQINEFRKCIGTDACPWESATISVVSMLTTSIRVVLVLLITFAQLHPVFVGVMFLIPMAIDMVTMLLFTKIVPYTKIAIRYSMNFREIFTAYNPMSQYYAHVTHAEIGLKVATDVADTHFKQSDQLVAVAVALGKVVLSNGAVQIHHSPCIINMKDSKIENTQNLARILPMEDPKTIRLCLHHTDIPKNESQVSADPVPSAVYFCDGAIALGHKERWNKTKDGEILYVLQYANSAIIYASDTYFNTFYIFNLIEESRIYGGKYKNKYDIMYARNTTFFWHAQSNLEHINLVSMQALKSSLHFHYYNQTHVLGELALYPDPPMKIYWQIKQNASNDDNITSVGITGSPEKIDEIQCMDNKMVENFAGKYFIQFDGNGGKSLTELDIMQDCQRSALRPFTKYITTIANTHYRIDVYPQEEKLNNSRTKVFSEIDIRGGTVGLYFSDLEWYRKTISMECKPNENTLTWTLQWSTDKILVLDIKGYRPNLTESQTAFYERTGSRPSKLNLRMFISPYEGVLFYSTFYPIMPENITSPTQKITAFEAIINVLKNTTSQEITHLYEKIMATKSPHLDLKITFCAEADCYSFGSNNSDQMPASSLYLAGFNGRDDYWLQDDSPEYVWINNNAEDDQLDVLNIADKLCDSLKVSRHRKDLPSVNHTEGDVIIKCESDVRALRINVILEKYSVDESYQHLIFLWNNKYHMIVPPDSEYLLIKQRRYNRPKTSDELQLIRFISLRPSDGPKITSVSGEEKHCFLYVPDAKLANFEASIENETHVLLVHKKIPEAALLLMNFYNPTTGSINRLWETNVFFISDKFSWKNPTVLGLNDIARIVDYSKRQHRRLPIINRDLNFAIFLHSTRNIIIDRDRLHGNNSMALRFDRPIQPSDVYVSWMNDKAALQICTKSCCAIVKNWCQSPRYRLKKIHFHFAYDAIQVAAYSVRQTSITINNIDELECELPYNSDQIKIVDELNFRITKAQELLEHYRKNPVPRTFDICVAFNYVDRVVHAPVYELFGYLDDRMFKLFQRNECIKDILKHQIMNLTRYAVSKTVESAMATYEIYRHLSKDSWPEREEIFRRIRDDIAKKGVDWPKFLTDVHHMYFKNDLLFDAKSIINVNEGRISELEWTEQLLRYKQCSNVQDL